MAATTSDVDAMPVEALGLGPARSALLRQGGMERLGDVRARLLAPEGPPDLGHRGKDIDWNAVAHVLAFFGQGADTPFPQDGAALPGEEQ